MQENVPLSPFIEICYGGAEQVEIKGESKSELGSGRGRLEKEEERTHQPFTDSQNCTVWPWEINLIYYLF